MNGSEKKLSGILAQEAALSRALYQSEEVQERVEKAGDDLSSVNRLIKDELSEELEECAPEHGIGGALKQSECIEAEVKDAAAQLDVVNQALTEEIEERQDLEQQLSESDAALFESDRALSHTRAALSRSQVKEREARRSALHDPITGLATLALFNDRLRKALAQSERQAGRLAVMFIDLDGFKAINDTHGHEFGDRVLQMVGQRLQANVRRGDTVCRRGGDEFLLLMLENRDGQRSAGAFAAKLLEALAEPWERDGVGIGMRASVGIALYPNDGQSEQLLLERADMAMYAAKRARTGWAMYGRMPHA